MIALIPFLFAADDRGLCAEASGELVRDDAKLKRLKTEGIALRRAFRERRSCGFPFLTDLSRLQAVKIGHRPLGMRRSLEDRPLVVLQHLEP